MAKKQTPAHATAKLPRPLHASGEELVIVTRQQVTGMQQSAGYPSHPGVQAAATTALASLQSYETTLSEIAKKRAELDALIGIRDTQHGAVLRDRRSIEAAVTTAAQGSAEVIQGLNCGVQSKAVPQPTDEAPTGLVLKADRHTPGKLSAKCKAIRGAGSYVFAFTSDPNAAPSTGTAVPSTKSRCVITGQQVGHLIYARVAVIRKTGGQSLWSNVVDILVR